MKLNLLLLGLLLSFLSDVATWTVNLAEMKILDTDKEKAQEEGDKKEFVYDALNKKADNLIDKSIYAKEYEYQGYKEKKVTNAIQNGSRYLEGLSQTLLEYRQMLESCGDTNTTESINKTKETQTPELNVTCNTATKNRKIVQKLSELALQTANKLKDRNYDMDKDGQREENEHVLQLAWFLDHLARLTGYAPSIDDFNTTDTSQLIEDADITNTAGDSSLELLETVENGRSMSKLPPKVTADKTVVKRSIRPLTDVVKYYTKYKLWNGSNFNTSDSNFDIDNVLRVKPIKKRSISIKKYNYLRHKNITKITKRIPYIDKLRKHGVVKVIVVKKSNKSG